MPEWPVGFESVRSGATDLSGQALLQLVVAAAATGAGAPEPIAPDADQFAPHSGPQGEIRTDPNSIEGLHRTIGRALGRFI